MFLDVTVVYFAFGAPVGVYEITRRRRSLRTAAAVCVRLVLWPVFAALSLRRSIAEAYEVGAEIERHADPIRREIEAAIFRGASDTEVREFRDVFARYTGLLATRNAANGQPRHHELLSLTRHGHVEIAAACFERRNHQRLEFHLAAARRDLAVVLEDAHVPAEIAFRLASLLRDPDLCVS